MRIRIINPIVCGAVDETSLPPMPDFVQAEIDWLEDGPSAIECRYDEALCVPPVLERIRAAAADGIDGIVVNCFMDPAVEPAREMVRVPMVGPGQSSMALAATLGQTFSVILPSGSGVPIAVEQAARYVGRERVVSIRSVETPVAELHDHDRLLERLVEQAQLAVEQDGAQVVILGCTGMCGITAGFKQRMEQLGLGVPIVDPTLAATAAVVAQSIAGLSHGERAYALPSWRTAKVA